MAVLLQVQGSRAPLPQSLSAQHLQPQIHRMFQIDQEVQTPSTLQNPIITYSSIVLGCFSYLEGLFP